MSSKAITELSKSMSEPCLPNWLELPRELTAAILLKLGPVEIMESAEKVCTQWRNICRDPSLWRSINMIKFFWLSKYAPNGICYTSLDLQKMCMRAVDRSCGGLVDLSIRRFCTDELLVYITQRTSNLKRLQLVFCGNISSKGLSEAALRFPLLEELVVSSPFCQVIQNASAIEVIIIEVIGRCCPLLKTFKYSRYCLLEKFLTEEQDNEALAIAQNMHGLLHLELQGNPLTNKGLEAILDGCPYLEILDLRRSSNVDLKGYIKKRCAEQIKMLRRPDDPVV